MGEAMPSSYNVSLVTVEKKETGKWGKKEKKVG